MSPDCTELRLKPGGLALEAAYADGGRFTLAAEYLRVESPSAEVQGHGPGQKTTVAGKRAVAIRRLEPVGHYAVRLIFDDGHDSGIFSFAYLRTLGLEQAERWAAYEAELAAKGLRR